MNVPYADIRCDSIFYYDWIHSECHQVLLELLTIHPVRGLIRKSEQLNQEAARFGECRNSFLIEVIGRNGSTPFLDSLREDRVFHKIKR